MNNINLTDLDLDEKILKKLKDNNINSFEELWLQNKKTLKELNFSQLEINSIIIKLQLKGLDLNKKKIHK